MSSLVPALAVMNDGEGIGVVVINGGHLMEAFARSAKAQLVSLGNAFALVAEGVALQIGPLSSKDVQPLRNAERLILALLEEDKIVRTQDIELA